MEFSYLRNEYSKQWGRLAESFMLQRHVAKLAHLTGINQLHRMHKGVKKSRKERSQGVEAELLIIQNHDGRGSRPMHLC